MASDVTLSPNFHVPAGQVLVLTGLDWDVIGAPPNSAVHLYVINDYSQVLVFATAMVDAKGAGGGHVDLSGFALKARTTPATNMCGYTSPSGQPVFVALHGFLAKDE